MFRHRRWTCSAFLLPFALMLVLAASLSATAAVGVDVSLGLGGRVVREHFAPIRVALSAVDQGAEGSIVVVQQIGSPLEEPEISSTVLFRGILEERTYEATIPIFYPLNPIEVRVEDADGNRLGAFELNLRLTRRMAPFQVVCGAGVDVGEDAVHIDASELPRDWWGLHAVSRLWLGGDSTPTTGEWRSISEWVLAGGSLILLTGTDFYRLDSPDFRALLPVRNPELVELADGRMRLSGEVREGSATASVEGDVASLVSWQYGAGHVVLVSAAGSELTPEKVEAVSAEALIARIPTMKQEAVLSMRDLSIVRPGFLVAPILVLGCALGLIGFARMGIKRPRMALALLVGTITVLSVWSGLVSKQANQVLDLYEAKTSVSLHAGYGIAIEWSSFYANRARSAEIEHEDGSYPVQSLVETVYDSSFALASEPDRTRVDLRTYEQRDLETYRRDATLLELRYEGSSIEIENHGEASVVDALLVADGMIYQLPPIPPGSHRLTPTGGIREFLFFMDRVPHDLILNELSDVLSFRNTVWLVFFEESEHIERWGEFGRKVRETEAIFVRGERS